MRRVVITGMGVVAPNAIGLDAFHEAQKNGISGIKHIPKFEELGFSCQVGGIPDISEIIDQYMNALEQRMIGSSGIRYGVIAGLQAWKDAGLEVDENDNNYENGIIFGAGISGVDKFREAIYKVDEGKVRRLGSTVVINTMTSGV
ncbi:beta-ketoacyl-[acyl-carrier-protein] synthase family protein, partial [Saprospiraceae bacterium]|nr:beta-ketoacyl-[acyl-carrier-protein] synthase family protein [Saprospiraceae bacterium]